MFPSGNVWLTLFLLLEFIPGVLCRYDFNMGGLVAAATVGFFLIIAIVIMTLVTFLWRDWFMERQLRKGKRREPRDLTMKGLFCFKKNKDDATEMMSTPRSDRMMVLHMPNGSRMGSRNTTLTRERQRTGIQEPFYYLPNAAKRDQFEVKEGKVDFEPEEEVVITTEVLPDQNQQRRLQQLGVTKKQQPFETGNPSYQIRQTTVGGSQQPGADSSAMGATYIPVTSESSATRINSHLSKTTAGTSYQREPVHVQMRPISQTTKTGSGMGNSYIIPNIQPPSPKANHGTPGVVVFDSDDEAGFVRNRENDVLF